jgi:preprotein translocase subunit YajC
MEEAMPFQLLANLGWHECSVLLFALLLVLVFFLVLRQNQKDFLEIEAWVTEEKPGL